MNITDINGCFELNNGVQMPYFGLGTWQSKNGKEVIDSVRWALEEGYKHIDTAAIYQNEDGVGKGVRDSGVNRSDLFITSKVWNGDQGYEQTIKAFNTSLKKLNMDYLDLYLIHWPVKGKYKETWRAMEQLYKEGKVRAIGVSNFLEHHLEDLLSEAKVTPMVNQMEFHPWLIQEDLVEYCRNQKIQYEAWSPIMRGRVGELEQLQALVKKHGKTEAQIVLRWNLQKGIVTIPKSIRKERIIENSQLFDFKLNESEVQLINEIDRNFRLGPDPDTFDF